MILIASCWSANAKRWILGVLHSFVNQKGIMMVQYPRIYKQLFKWVFIDFGYFYITLYNMDLANDHRQLNVINIDSPSQNSLLRDSKSPLIHQLLNWPYQFSHIFFLYFESLLSRVALLNDPCTILLKC